MITQRNLTLVNTRPAHQADHLNTLLQSMGVNTINFPTLEIKPLDADLIKKACQQLDQADIAVFVSANAAHCSHDYWPNPFPSINVIAIGPGTKKTLAEYNLDDVATPKTFNSEGILDLPNLQSIQYKKIMIFCGERSRPTLRQALINRGADVILCECYRRQCPKTDDFTTSLLIKRDIDGIISTSQESLKNLDSLLANLNADFKKTPLIVISPGMANLAATLGWKNVIIADGASDLAIVKMLPTLRSN